MTEQRHIPVLTEQAQKIETQELIFVRALGKVDFVVKVVAFELRQIPLKARNVLACHGVEGPSFQNISCDQQLLRG